MSFQTCMALFLLQNRKADILKYERNQSVLVPTGFDEIFYLSKIKHFFVLLFQGQCLCMNKTVSYTILFYCIFVSMNCALCFVSGLGPIHMNEVQCTGHERSLWNCRYKNITAEDCKHTEDASVRCNVPYMGYEKTVRATHTYSHT